MIPTDGRDLVNTITKREYFAAMRRPAEGEEDSLSVSYAKAIMKSDVPSGILDNIKWWAEAEERLAVIRADALINALNQSK